MEDVYEPCLFQTGKISHIYYVKLWCCIAYSDQGVLKSSVLLDAHVNTEIPNHPSNGRVTASQLKSIGLNPK